MNHNVRSFTSAQILDMDVTALAALFEHGEAIIYESTDAEGGALRFIGHRYEIAHYLIQATDEDGAITIEPHEVQEALASEGLDRVPLLSEDTALARIIWVIGDGA